MNYYLKCNRLSDIVILSKVGLNSCLPLLSTEDFFEQ